MKKPIPEVKRNAITVYELLSQGFDVRFFCAQDQTTEKNSLVLSKGKYSETTYFTFGQNMDHILYSTYTTIIKEQRKDLL